MNEGDNRRLTQRLFCSDRCCTRLLVIKVTAPIREARGNLPAVEMSNQGDEIGIFGGLNTQWVIPDWRRVGLLSARLCVYCQSASCEQSTSSKPETPLVSLVGSLIEWRRTPNHRTSVGVCLLSQTP